MAGAFGYGADTYDTSIAIDSTDPFLAFVDARKALNDDNVPKGGRFMLVGSSVEADILKSDRLTKFDQGAGATALEEATIGRMAGFTVNDPGTILLGRETILRNGEPVGYLTSGGFGYTLGKSIGYGYVKNPEGVSEEYLNAGSYQLVVANEVVDARLSLEPFYDPQNRRIKD